MAFSPSRIIFAALLAAFAVGPALAINVGDPLPPHQFDDLGGTRHDLGQHRSVRLIYFTGFACGVCVDVAGDLESSFRATYEREGLDVIAIDAWDGAPEELERFRAETGARYPFLLNGSAFMAECGVTANSFLVVDDHGIVRYVSVGPDATAYDPGALETAVEHALDDAAAAHLNTWGAIKSLYDERRMGSAHRAE